MYEAHVKRKAVESAVLVRNAMISGLWSNSNYDDDKNSRNKALQEVEDAFQASVISVYTGKSADDEIDFENDPFFAAMKLPSWDDVKEVELTDPVPTTTTDERVPDIDQG